MNYRMTKKQAVQQFRWDWSDFLKSNPHFRGDSIAKRCAFNDYVDRLVDNMSTKDLVQYVFDDMTQYVDNQSDTEFLEDCRNYWEDYFDEVIEEVKEYANSDFKKSIEDRRAE